MKRNMFILVLLAIIGCGNPTGPAPSGPDDPDDGFDINAYIGYAEILIDWSLPLGISAESLHVDAWTPSCYHHSVARFYDPYVPDGTCDDLFSGDAPYYIVTVWATNGNMYVGVDPIDEFLEEP